MYVKVNSLYHHGIKGQKWGVRRFQNKDGSLTAAGRKRYDDDNGGSREKKQKEYKVPKNKSLHRLKIEEKYKKQGMSEKEAEQAAAKRIKGEQYAVAAAAVTVAACVAYNKYKNHNVDKVLKNVEFHRVMTTDNPDAPVREGARYVAYNKNDRMKYRGIYGDELRSQNQSKLGGMKIESEMSRLRGQKFGPEKMKAFDEAKKAADNKKVYDMTMKSKHDIKVASEKRARETFEKLYKNDPEFRKNLAERVKDQRLNMLAKKGMLKSDVVDQLIAEGKGMSDKEMKSKAYDLFNIMLVDSDERSRSNQNKFYNALKEQGMNAVQDINDKKYSGYNTKAPLIMFDGDFEYSKKVLSNEEINKAKKLATHQLVTAPLVTAGASLVASMAVTPVMDNRAAEKMMIEYKREHPNTKMSDAELKKMFKKQIKDQYK